MVSIPFLTKPREKDVLMLKQAKLGDPKAVAELRKEHDAYVWKHSEIEALNLFLSLHLDPKNLFLEEDLIYSECGDTEISWGRTYKQKGKILNARFLKIKTRYFCLLKLQPQDQKHPTYWLFERDQLEEGEALIPRCEVTRFLNFEFPKDPSSHDESYIPAYERSKYKDPQGDVRKPFLDSYTTGEKVAAGE